MFCGQRGDLRTFIGEIGLSGGKFGSTRTAVLQVVVKGL